MAAGFLHAIGRSLLDFAVPPRCLACTVVVSGDGGLCPACWAALDFIAGAVCARCGVPLSSGRPAGECCAACAAAPPPFDRARAALRYDDASRPLILGLKHRDRTDSAPVLARWMARAGAGLLGDAEVIVPVPLHWTRLLARRFNQSALLAALIGREAGVTVLPDGLVRRRRTPSQGHLSRAGRARNVQGAFAVRKRLRPRIDGRGVLLIDDVLTSGATAAACARALRRAGAVRVDVLALARVAAPGTAPEPDAE